MKVIKAIRGAVKLDEDSRESAERWILRMMDELMRGNALEEKDIISILFSQTKDIKIINPAAIIRIKGFAGTPLFCTQEPEVEGSMERVVRVMVTFYCKKNKRIIPVYLNGAEGLRKDLFRKEP